MTRVIFHIDHYEDWPMALTNMKNFLKEEPEAEIEALANGNAVILFQTAETEMKETWQALADEGVDFALCRNALNHYAIKPSELDSRLRVVPAGVVELAKKQKEGFVYIKP